MAARRSNRRRTEQPPEDKAISRNSGVSEKRLNKEKEKLYEESNSGREENIGEAEEVPYANVVPLPIVHWSDGNREWKEKAKDHQQEKGNANNSIPNSRYKNQAALQSDERARELIGEALKSTIGITAEDLLSISEPARQELRGLLTKRRIETKSIALVAEEGATSVESSGEGVIYGEKLPGVDVAVIESYQQAAKYQPP